MMAYYQQLFLGDSVRYMELRKISMEYRNDAWVNAVNAVYETPLHILARHRNLHLFKRMLPHYTNIEATDDQGNTVLHLLVDHKIEELADPAMQRTDLLRTLISMGADVNERNVHGWALVHFAAKRCHVDMLNLLEKNEADFNVQTNEGETVLLLACKHMLKDCESKIIEFLIGLVANINATDEEGYSALHYAVERCSSITVIKLLKHGADVHLCTKEHKLTPLHLAVKKNHNLDVVEALLNAGAIVEPQEIEELTPLQISVLEGSPDVVEYLIENGANVNCIEEYLQFTPIHLAICQQHYDLLKLLVDNGADVNGSGKDGLTPLHLSSMLGCPQFTEALLFLGARVNCYYNNQLVPLHLSSMKSRIRENTKRDKKSLISKLLAHCHYSHHFEIRMDLLLRKEAYPKALTTSAWNLLHFAAKLRPNTGSFVKLLYDHGANVKYQEPHSGLTALHLALANNFQTIVEILVRAGADVNVLAQTGQRPIHLALQSGCSQVLKLLIHYKADVNCKQTGSQLTPLHLALNKNNRYAAEILIEAGADVNQLTSDGKSPVHVALEANCLEALKALISHGANSNYKDANSQLTPLHLALLKNDRGAAEILIDAGADVNALTRDGKSPIQLDLESTSFRAHYDRSAKILKLLLDRGADVNRKEPQSQLTALHLALYKRYEDAALILINAGADVNAQTQDGKSPLHLALETNCMEVLKLLIPRGANVNCKATHSDIAPLHIALLKNQRDAVEILISARADVNDLTRNGLRPIHLALLSNDTKALKLLLDNGAYVDGKEIQSQLTPLHLALYKNYRDAAAILIDARAEVNSLTLDGKSPLHLALESNCMELSRVLIERGATLNCKEKRCLYTLFYIGTLQQNDDDTIGELNHLGKSLLFQAVDAQESCTTKRAILRLCALVDAFNKRSCMPIHPEVDKCCIENSACLPICAVDSRDFEAYSKFISYRVLSGDFHEFNNCQIKNEMNSKYLCNYLSMLNTVNLPLTSNYETIELPQTSLFFAKHEMKIYDQKCLDEVKKLKSYSVNDGVTLYEVLHMRPKLRRFYTKNLDLSKIKRQFEIYHKLILASFYEDKIKTLLMETVQSAFYRLTNVHLPISLIQNIFLDLGIVNIIATVEAAERIN